jgi:uncharacterized membrane protein
MVFHEFFYDIYAAVLTDQCYFTSFIRNIIPPSTPMYK